MNKKLMMVYVLALVGLLEARAEDVLQVTPFATTAGVVEDEWKTFSIEMNNTQEYTALQFDLYLPEGLTLIEEGPMELNADRFPGYVRKGVFYPEHEYECTKKDDRHYLITLYHSDFGVIKESEGELLIFYYETSSDMADGYYPITVSGTVLTIDSHNQVKPATSTSFVKIGEPEKFDASLLSGYIPSFVVSSIPRDEAAYDFSHVDEMAADFTPTNPNAIQYVKAESSYAAVATGNVVVDGVCENLVLTDGYSFAAPESFTATKASYTRNAANDWGTICLPYAVESNGSVQFYQLKEVEEDAFVFGKVAGLAAGEPGVFVRLDDKNIVLNAENATICTAVGEGTESAGMTIVGIFDKTRVDVDDSAPSYYIKSNAFCKGTGYFTVPAFRAYYQSAGIASAKQKVYRIAVEDEATGIVQVMGELDTKQMDVYTIQGVKATDFIQRGIYIRDGKKFFNKNK